MNHEYHLQPDAKDSDGSEAVSVHFKTVMNVNKLIRKVTTQL